MKPMQLYENSDYLKCLSKYKHNKNMEQVILNNNCYN